MTHRELASLISLTLGPAVAALGWALATDYRRIKTRHATRTVRAASILFPGFRDGNEDERIVRQQRQLTSMGWAFMIAGGFQTLGGIYIAAVGLPQ